MIGAHVQGLKKFRIVNVNLRYCASISLFSQKRKSLTASVPFCRFNSFRKRCISKLAFTTNSFEKSFVVGFEPKSLSMLFLLPLLVFDYIYEKSLLHFVNFIKNLIVLAKCFQKSLKL